jgi:predicted O-methyltransferase YrrM
VIDEAEGAGSTPFPSMEWLDDAHLRVDGVGYTMVWDGLVAGRLDAFAATDDFHIWRFRSEMLALLHLVREYQRGTMVEVGIAQGGTTALLAQVLQPRKLIAVELSTEPLVQLDRFIHTKGLEAVVRPFLGVDQADRSRVEAILQAELRDEPLDLVIDDGSHFYEQTLITLDILFPRLRPGGLYVIEDWNWHEAALHRLPGVSVGPTPEGREALHQLVAASFQAPASPDGMAVRLNPAAASPTGGQMEGASGRPLSRLILELVLAVAASAESAASLQIGHGWAAIRRGPAVLDPATFSAAALAEDPNRLLAP